RELQRHFETNSMRGPFEPPPPPPQPPHFAPPGCGWKPEVVHCHAGAPPGAFFVESTLVDSIEIAPSRVTTNSQPTAVAFCLGLRYASCSYGRSRCTPRRR